MIKVRFIGAPVQDGMPEDYTQVNKSYGYTFPRGQWVEVSGEAAIKLPKNCHFEAEVADDADFVEVADEPVDVNQSHDESVGDVNVTIDKPKRKRRTKAEMEAARVAE